MLLDQHQLSNICSSLKSMTIKVQFFSKRRWFSTKPFMQLSPGRVANFLIFACLSISFTNRLFKRPSTIILQPLCSCHVTYAFESKSTLYSCLKVKELLARRDTLKHVRDMKRTYSQMHRTDKYSEHSSIIWPVSPNDWVFV